MSHVDEGRLHAWLDYGRSGMTEAEYIEVGSHLARCAECAALLAEERALRERASAILGGTGPRAAAPPSFEALAERARAAGHLPAGGSAGTGIVKPEEGRDWSGRRNRRPLVGLAWAASVMAALGLGWAASTLVDREQVAIQSVEETSAGASADAAAMSREGAPIDLTGDPAVPEMAAPPAMQRAMGEAGPAGGATAADPSSVAVADPQAPISRVAIESPPGDAPPPVNVEELVVVGYGSQSRATVSGRVAPEAGQPPQLRTAAATAADAAQSEVAASDRNGGMITLADRPPAAAPRPEPTLRDATGLPTGPAASAGERAGPAPAPAAPPAIAGMATPSAVAYLNQPPGIWSVVSDQQAMQRLGRPVLIHPGFPLLRIEVPSDGQLPVVRVVHALPGGGVLTITQSRITEAESTIPTPPGAATIVRDDLIVTGAGPISADSIATLLEGVR